ncbi:MAG TPA: hypothetical protein VMS30_11030 [Phycisphaerales bacterium]|jgi:hypothetical protein|nr:hypothetical protein [Phycisphaerales bacterium]
MAARLGVGAGESCLAVGIVCVSRRRFEDLDARHLSKLHGQSKSISSARRARADLISNAQHDRSIRLATWQQARLDIMYEFALRQRVDLQNPDLDKACRWKLVGH